MILFRIIYTTLLLVGCISADLAAHLVRAVDSFRKLSIQNPALALAETLVDSIERDPAEKAALEKVDLEMLNQYGFDYVLSSEHTPTVLPLLLKHIVKSNPKIARDALESSIVENDVKSFRRLLEAGVSPSYDNNSPFRLAADNERTEILEILMKTQGVNPSANNNEALRTAFTWGRKEIVEQLIFSGTIDVSTNENEPIRLASLNGYEEVVKHLLLSPNVDPSARNSEAFYFAVINGHLGIVKLLIEDGRVDPTDDNLAVFVKAKQWSQGSSSSFYPQQKQSFSDIVSFLQQDEMVSSILFLQSKQALTPTRFLGMINSKRAWSHASYIESVLKFPQVSALLSDVIRIDPEAARKITTLEQLNEHLLQSLELDMNHQKPLSKRSLEFLWNLYGKKNLELIVSARKGNLDKVKALLNDPDIDPSAKNYLAISVAFEGGHDKVVEVLEEHELKKLQNKPKQCFCMGELFPGMVGVTSKHCGHSFHTKCIDAWTWTQIHASCPFCRSPI